MAEKRCEKRYEKQHRFMMAQNPACQAHPAAGTLFCVSEENPAVREAHGFHQGLPGYGVTPLEALPALAARLGAGQILVKDESKRFGLNAFKALGGSYAIARYLCDRLHMTPDRETFGRLTRDETLRKAVEGLTFVTATDGNHGRGVAWTAHLLGCRSVVYLPAGSARERLLNIQALGAEAEITPYTYDDAVRYAKAQADRYGWILIQDTAWDGYEAIPTAIMQGYTTLAWETGRQLAARGDRNPTHIFLQAGVGSMAGAVAGYLTGLWPEDRPRIIIVEPDKADCLYRTALAADGCLHTVTGPMDSMMAGLCCGEPCTIGWQILRELACAFIACDDSYAALGMRLLAHPAEGDPAIVSGESGAVTVGVVAGLYTDPALAPLKEQLGLDSTSRILTVSTEGDTDRENYRRVVDGEIFCA